MRLIASALCVMTLTACSIRQPHGDVTLPPDGDQAMIVMSTRVDDKCGGSFLMVLLGTEWLRGNKIQTGAVQLTNAVLKSDFTDPPGFLYTLKVDAGDLRLTKLTRSSTKRGFQAERDLDFQVHIEPGKVYYLGELYVELDCKGFNLRINDQRRRDGALFDQRMTTLKSSMFEYRLLGTN